MSKRKREPAPQYVDLETGKLRDVGDEDSGKRSTVLGSLKRFASDAVMRRVSTKR